MLNYEQEAHVTLERLLPPLLSLLPQGENPDVLRARLQRYMPTVLRLLSQLYGDRYDFFYHLEEILKTTVKSYSERSASLKALDIARERDPHWYLNHQIVGAVCYVDLFAGDLAGVREKIGYFKELGINYLHLMPLFKAPEDDSDGGYAISDFRQVNPQLGTMDELRSLADELRANGISLVLDFVFNHTADEHPWAKAALAGDEHYRKYYFFFPDRTLPDQYQRMLREIFPEQAPGSFTYLKQIDQWVWTTFNVFQWDLNYSNPETFNAMLGEMLFLANQGVEVLRLDAVAFVWKQLGTICENLPQVHLIIRAMNALTRIAAPTMLFKSEAIVHPDDVVSYIHPDECQISYNPTYMASIWEALATREVNLLRQSMGHRYDLPEGCAWVNYVRVHDDIGWSFANEDAQQVGIKGFDHRIFLNQFYIGKFPGSFATGVPFNYNPVTQDMRICGTAASLAGLELGLGLQNQPYVDHAVRRLLMIHSLIIGNGGIPLLYSGDEIATLNDYSYRSDPHKQAEHRWVHRPKFDWNRAAQRHDVTTPQGQVFSGIQYMINLRQQLPAFDVGKMVFFDSENKHILSYTCNNDLLVLANFSDHTQYVSSDVLRRYWTPIQPAVDDLITWTEVDFKGWLTLEPYQFMWLQGRDAVV
jgi:amylosucrase